MASNTSTRRMTMRSKLMKFSGVSVMAMALILGACESLSDNALTGPSDRSDILIINTTKSGYTIARQTDVTTGIVTAVVDQNGGRLSLGQHQLEIPAGAVSAPTTFTMAQVIEDEIKVSLTATRLLPNDVGHAGFAVPVKLTLSYDKAAQLPSNLADLRIVWIKSDGSTEPQSTALDVQGKRVTGSLDHFSDYGLGWP